MFVDARTLPERFAIDVDVCIVGAGAAGITLARDLAGGSRRIALLESGDFEYNADTQELYAGEVDAEAYAPLDRDRLRFFGGTTNHWEGSCRPFDALDLAAWPIGTDALAPFYPRAHKICQLGPFDYDPEHWSVPEAQPFKLSPDSALKNGLFQYSPPTRFGQVYRDDLANASGVTVYLNANLLKIDTNDSASAVTGLQIACLDGKRGRVGARYYVLATGGIENA
ncbi:MAG TPA: FAD-dependent oxidoreductase, partial [Steroidobacteraceae bacterium]